ncbi:MAG TPA: hypothetical protein VJ001_05890 [Rhodocyclaceae bacterium]|nr:hypothetical protein [Rhodocyclaceae bacterium]
MPQSHPDKERMPGDLAWVTTMSDRLPDLSGLLEEGEKAPAATKLECRCALEELGHLSKKIIAIWGSPELDMFLSELIMDSRDGTRQGLPMAAAAEVLFLMQTNKMVRAIDLAEKLNIPLQDAFRTVDEGDQARLRNDVLDDPAISRDTARKDVFGESSPRYAGRPVAAANQDVGFGALLAMLFGSKWLIGAVMLIVGYKLLWPTLQTLF